MKLTPEEKEIKRSRDNLQVLCNRIASAFSFGKIKTWSDVYAYTSIPANCTNATQQVKFPELKEYFNKLKGELEVTLASKKAVVAHGTVERSEEPTLVLHPAEIPTLDNDYLLPPCAREHPHLIRYWFQRKAAKEMYDNIKLRKFRGQQLIAAAGYGKTFIAGAVAARLKDEEFGADLTFGPVTYLYVTKNSVVEQTARVFEKMFNLTIKDGFEVINYESLRSKAGTLWVKEKLYIEQGVEKFKWEWRRMMNPVVIFWDENHSLKNYGSQQHLIASEFNNIATPTYQIFISATPYMRVSEAKCFAVSTRKDISHITGVPANRLSNETWPTYSSIMAGNSNPEEYNEAAVERITKDLEPYIIRVKGVRPQFHALNRVEMIQFRTREEKQFYDETEERYLRKKQKLEADIDAGICTAGGLMHLVLLTQRAIAAEQCRVHHFGDFMLQAVKDGYAGVCAVKYKTTLIPLVKYLESKGVSRNNISLVWGGGQSILTKKQKAKAAINAKIETLTALGMDPAELLKELDLEDVEDKVIEELPEHLRLGAQSKEERQREIDRFQSGKTLFCIYTFKAGGVGLSLHHTDELTKEKVRRQKNGYAVVEDIPKIPTRPRKVALSVAYSGIDMVQSTGRVPRLTSLSETEQVCLLYANTVEVDIAAVYSSKLRCHNKVIRMRESWLDLIMGGDREELVKCHIRDDQPDGEDDELITATESDEE